MLPVQLDHLTITAPTLEAGAQFVQQALGVLPQPGGEHARMGTHNLLLRLGEAIFLEVIAINPQANGPGRPRWFGLDHLEAQPRLATWVARTADIHASNGACGGLVGTIEAMSRGALDWFITIPEDGSLVLGGAAPALIEWHCDLHPASALRDHGLSLSRLELFHPEPARISKLLQSLELDSRFEVVALHAHEPRLVAHINTAHGVRTL